MKSIIIYNSIHHGNTEKIAKVMAEELDCEIVRVFDLKNIDISDYDLIGFGSGIYMGNFNGFILNIIDRLVGLENKKVFIFSTSGSKEGFFNNFSRKIKEKLLQKNVEILGCFNCLGFDTFGPLKFFGGINRNRPNELDIESAREFAKKIEVIFLSSL